MCECEAMAARPCHLYVLVSRGREWSLAEDAHRPGVAQLGARRLLLRTSLGWHSWAPVGSCRGPELLSRGVLSGHYHLADLCCMRSFPMRARAVTSFAQCHACCVRCVQELPWWHLYPHGTHGVWLGLGMTATCRHMARKSLALSLLLAGHSLRGWSLEFHVSLLLSGVEVMSCAVSSGIREHTHAYVM